MSAILEKGNRKEHPHIHISPSNENLRFFPPTHGWDLSIQCNACDSFAFPRSLPSNKAVSSRIFFFRSGISLAVLFKWFWFTSSSLRTLGSVFGFPSMRDRLYAVLPARVSVDAYERNVFRKALTGFSVAALGRSVALDSCAGMPEAGFDMIIFTVRVIRQVKSKSDGRWKNLMFVRIWYDWWSFSICRSCWTRIDWYCCRPLFDEFEQINLSSGHATISVLIAIDPLRFSEGERWVWYDNSHWIIYWRGEGRGWRAQWWW